jgi:hypothetical protein
VREGGLLERLGFGGRENRGGSVQREGKQGEGKWNLQNHEVVTVAILGLHDLDGLDGCTGHVVCWCRFAGWGIGIWIFVRQTGSSLNPSNWTEQKEEEKNKNKKKTS